MTSAPPAPARSRALVVLGMHRSGTSALARCLSLLGAGIGEKLIPANWGNERGFWEDEEVVAADDAALAALGLSWHDPSPMEEDRWSIPALADARRRLTAVVRAESARHPLWVVKDPRISRLVPLWRSIFAECDVEPLFLLSLRHPQEVAASQARRDGFPAGKSHLLWLRHMLEAERHTRDASRVVVSYDDLLGDWRDVLARVGDVLGVAWPVAIDDAAPSIEEFLSRSLRHFSVGDRAAAPEEEIGPWPRAIYAALDAGVAAPSSAATVALDRVHEEIGTTDRIYGPVLTDLALQLRETRAAVDSEHAGWAQSLEANREREAEIVALRRRVAIAEERLSRTVERLTHAEAIAERERVAGVALRERAAHLALRAESQEGRRIHRLLARLQPSADLSSAIAPSFRQLVDDSRLFAGDLRGYALAPSESLRRVGTLAYSIAIDRAGLIEVWLAVAMDLAPTSGSIAVEILTDAGQLLRRAERLAASASESEPLRFAFPPLADSHRRAHLRVSASGLDVPLRIFEWQRVELGGLGRRRVRAFCALEFAQGVARNDVEKP